MLSNSRGFTTSSRNCLQNNPRPISISSDEISRAARSYRALDSPPTWPRFRSSRSAIAGGGSSSTSEGEGCPRAPAGGRSPGALASARAQGGTLRLVPACIRIRQHSTRFHERRRVARRVARRAPASVSDHQDLLSFVSVLQVAPGGTQRAWLHGNPGVLGAFSRFSGTKILLR